ncbi:ABC transporter permease [Microtetraspora sp. NBRC 13810]|uniref:ABC transporter permease n=1 Tax=Microtetraspora sp. NBRC 13810 TaxID=3030990 RepID=UPI0024A4C2C2|nr:ABC transporter permease [Microtetraspora sp. NBRC 13810]GLW06988.1 ABC transporter permease [Microtetraspora sp. NBRC 13810]
MSGVMLSEWTKLRTVRSTVWTMLGVVIVMIGFGYLNAAAARGQADRHPMIDPALLTLGGAPVASLMVASLGVLAISGEYRTGMIRTTLLAVPRRMRMLAAKTAVFTVFSLTVSLLTCFATFFVGQVVLGPYGTGLGEPGVLRIVGGCALYITGSGVFGLALGALVRHTAGGIVAVTVTLFLLPQLVGVIPGGTGARLMPYVTSVAGMRVMSPETAGGLAPWTGFGVFCLWIAVALAGAAYLLRRRDA